MAFKKGQSGNPRGRPKGSYSKGNASLRGLVSDFLNQNWDEFGRSFKKLEPKEKVMMYERLLKYGLPQLQAVSITQELEAQLGTLTDEQLSDLMTRVVEIISQKKDLSKIEPNE